MKKIFFVFISIFSVVFYAHAQKKTSGAIQFENTTDPTKMMAASGIKLPEQAISRMPSTSKTQFELLFTPTAASYMPVEDAEDSNGGGGGGGFGGRMMRFGGMGGAREYYYSFADKKLTEVFDISDTTYYMPSQLKVDVVNPMVGFRMGGGNDTAKAQPVVPPVIEIVKTDSTRNIIGFKCKEVIVKSTKKVKVMDVDMNTTEETRIWYTTELGFDFSPNPNLWTEGTVLAIEARGNSTIAKSIEYRNVSAKDVTAPKKAKLITADEYKVKMDALMKRFRNMRPSGSGGAIRTMQIN